MKTAVFVVALLVYPGVAFNFGGSGRLRCDTRSAGNWISSFWIPSQRALRARPPRADSRTCASVREPRGRVALPGLFRLALRTARGILLCDLVAWIVLL